MMRLSIRALLLVALFAGCAAPQADAPREAGLERASRAVALTSCDILEALVSVPEARAREFVPPGFSLLATGDSARVVLGAATCAQGSRAFLAIPVEPEDERLRAQGVRHFFEPEHAIVAGEALAEAIAALRGNATNATRIVADAAPPRPALVVELAGGAHSVAAVGGALAPASDAAIGGVFREWFPARGGFGYLEARFGTEGARFALLPQARVETGEGTVSREVIGAEATGDLFVLDGSAYADATLGFVPYP